jgi:hypothetical protein
LDKPTLKLALTFLKHCLIEADIKFAEKVLVTNLEQNVCDPKALWTTYYRLKENVQIYNYQTRKDLLPAMPQYKITLSDYDSLIGGDRL